MVGSLTLLLGGVKWHSYRGNSSEVGGLWVFGLRLSENSVVVLGVAPIALLMLVIAYRNGAPVRLGELAGPKSRSRRRRGVRAPQYRFQQTTLDSRGSGRLESG